MTRRLYLLPLLLLCGCAAPGTRTAEVKSALSFRLADINQDGRSDMLDAALFQQVFGKPSNPTPPPPRTVGDIDGRTEILYGQDGTEYEVDVGYKDWQLFTMSWAIPDG